MSEPVKQNDAERAIIKARSSCLASEGSGDWCDELPVIEALLDISLISRLSGGYTTPSQVFNGRRCSAESAVRTKRPHVRRTNHECESDAGIGTTKAQSSNITNATITLPLIFF